MVKQPISPGNAFPTMAIGNPETHQLLKLAMVRGFTELRMPPWILRLSSTAVDQNVSGKATANGNKKLWMFFGGLIF